MVPSKLSPRTNIDDLYDACASILVKWLEHARAKGVSSGVPIHCLNPFWSSHVSITSQGKVSSTSRPPTTAFHRLDKTEAIMKQDKEKNTSLFLAE
jgi:hypothetical protein